MQKNQVSNRVSEKLFEKLGCAYLCIDSSFVVINKSDYLEEFGFKDIPVDSDVTDYIDFLVGIDLNLELHLPVLISPSGRPIAVEIFPEDDGAIVIISDASSVFAQRQMLQQAANENELLLDEQKKLTQQLELAKSELQSKNLELEEAARLQNSFLSGVSHEFRTPLTSIIGYIKLLRRNLESASLDTDQSKQYLSAVKRSSEYLLSLVENLLDHGKVGSDEIVINPKPSSLNDIFNDVAILLEPLTTTKNIELVMDYDFSESLTVMVDDSRIRQCLINIVGNAIKFTDVGEVAIKARWEDEQLHVIVKDTGIGIDAIDLNKIKMPFWQAPNTGKAGTGLGLTITDKIIDLMGGELNIKSRVGHGTEVTFQLMAPAINKLEEVSQERNASDRKLHILLAEDDADIANLVILLLQEQGVEVTHAENGALAIAAIEESTFDLILMDIHMPVMDGYTAIENIRDSGNSTPVVIMSASAIEYEKNRAEQLGCDGYLVKPVDVEDILLLADQVIN